MADGITVPDLTTGAGVIAALVIVVGIFWRKIQTDGEKRDKAMAEASAKTAEILAQETKRCEDNYDELRKEFREQTAWQRDTFIGVIEANTMELNAMRRDLRTHDLVPQDPEASLSLPPNKSSHLRVKPK